MFSFWAMEIEDKATSPPPPPHPPPPPKSEATASPSHDFSFTISLQTLSSPGTLRSSVAKPPSSSSAAFDLAPADDIFLHGHLLPLHLLSHPGSPPRASDISLDNFTYPLGHTDSDRHLNYFNPSKPAKEESRATKPPSAFASFFGLARLRRRNEKEATEEAATATATTKRKKKGLDVSRLLRKYASLVELLFFFRTGERERRRRDDDLRRRPCSFSGLSNRNTKAAAAAAQGEWWRRRKGQMSAPASIRTSPTNSGLLSASSMTISSASTSDSSTMEELQSAIQAAIAHCKNSIAVAAKQKAGDT